jgi:hypothetical protein
MKLELTIWKHLRDAMRASDEPEHARVIADLFWRTLIVVSFIAVMCSLWYGWTLFDSVIQTMKAQPSTTTRQTGLDHTKIDAVVAAFNDRTSRYTTLKTQPLVLPDPSK